MIGRNIGFTRWYDCIPELSQAVRLMERMPPRYQKVLSDCIIGSLQMHQVAQGSDGLKKLGTEKVLGLMKSKTKRRWYDQDPQVHQAFNFIYLMDDLGRYETAIKILIAGHALEEAERKGINDRMLPVLTRSIFERTLQSLMETTEFVFTSKTGESMPIQIEIEPLLPLPDASASSGAISVSHEGSMKVMRLKKYQGRGA